MSTDGDMRERHGRVLAELAEAGMVMVRRLGEAMQRTDDVRTQAQIGLAFHRVSRAVRQTMALEFRLAQDARREERGAVAPARPPEPKPAGPARPRPPVERTGWSEYEADDSNEPLDALDALLEAEDLDVEAVHEAVEASMARIRRDIAADPVLARAGVPEPADAAPSPMRSGHPPALPGGRRSELLGATALPQPPRVVFPPPLRAWRSSA